LTLLYDIFFPFVNPYSAVFLQNYALFSQKNHIFYINSLMATEKERKKSKNRRVSSFTLALFTFI